MAEGKTGNRSRILWILIVLAVAAAGIYFWWGRGEPAPVWRTVVVERGPIQVAVTATGTVQAVVTVQVGTQVSGTISALYADFNSKVKKNQVIARLDTTLLVAALADSKSSLSKAQAQEHQSAEELKRTRALFERTLVSQADLDQAVAAEQVAQANLASAKAQVDRARINLRYATIVSPIDGIILSRAVDVGQTVAASFNTPTLFTIAGDLRQMQVQAAVDEADIGKIKLGQNASFNVDAYPDTQFTGTVEQIRLQPTTEQNVVTYQVVIGVPNPDLRLMPGMTANLSVVVAHKDDVLLVPAAALRFQPPDKGKQGKHAGAWAGRDSSKSQSAGPGGESQPGAEARAPGDSAGRHKGGWPRGDSARSAWKAQHAGGAGQGNLAVTGGEAHRGRVFVLEGKTLRPVRVETGLSDGARTEVSGSLEPGMTVVTGIQAPEPKNQGSTPFGMPRGGPGGGGGGRR